MSPHELKDIVAGLTGVSRTRISVEAETLETGGGSNYKVVIETTQPELMKAKLERWERRSS